MKRSLTAIAAALLGAATIMRVQAAIPVVPGFQLIWADDFDGQAGSPPDPNNWIIDLGTNYPGGPANWGTGEKQTYTGDAMNLRLDGNGVLEIQAHRDDATGQWTSARIETQRADFATPLGCRMRIQASLNLPDVPLEGALGYWPAFWTLGSRYRGNYQNWPAIGEFDIMENVNAINGVWGVHHCGTFPGGPCKETEGLGGGPRVCPGSPCQGHWHTYTLEVDRRSYGGSEALRWFVDGVQFFEISSDLLPAPVWAQAVHESHFILLNLAMGGAFPNGNFGSATPVESTMSGGVFRADYVAVYLD